MQGYDSNYIVKCKLSICKVCTAIGVANVSRILIADSQKPSFSTIKKITLFFENCKQTADHCKQTEKDENKLKTLKHIFTLRYDFQSLT